jgi:hypothetical protein
MALVTRFRAAGKSPSTGKPFLSKGADVYSFVLGLASVFSVHLVGELYLAEVLLILVLPALVILRGHRALRPELKLIYILMGLWLLGLVVSDVYNEIEIVDRIRGSALIIFFAINLLGMSMILGRNEKRKILYLIGLMVGALAAVRLQPSPAVEAYPWKFGYAWGTIQLVMLVSSYFYGRRLYVISASLVLGICLVNLLLNFRGPVLGLLITVVLIYPIIPERVIGMRIVPNSQLARLAILAVLAIVAGETSGALVTFVTQSGYVNQQAQAKNESQAKLGFLGGRPEFAVGLRAALDSPIIGHGSWAKDFKYLEMLNDMEVEAGVMDYSPDFEEDANGLIPGHSQIITAWVWAGIGGLIFWAYMVWFFLQGIMRVAVLRPSMAPAYMLFLIGMWWDIFFSPFAANRRIILAVMIVLVADLLEKKVVIVQNAWRRMGAVPRARSLGQGNSSTAPIRPQLGAGFIPPNP